MLESLDHNILLGFVEEAQSYTPTIRQGIIAFRADARRRDEIQQAYRQIHTIKGAALMIGLFELGEIAGQIEAALEPLANGKGSLETQTSISLLVRLDEVENLLEAKAAELRSESAECGVRSAEYQNDELGMMNDEQNHHSSFIIPNSSFQETPHSEDEVEKIDPEMLEVFSLEAEEHLQNISANLQILEQNPHNGEALQSIRRSSHTLKGAAGVVGFKTISHLAHRMEDLLDYLAEQPLHSTPQTTALLLAATDALEALSRGATKNTLQSELASLYARFDAMLKNGVDSVSDSLPEFAVLQNAPKKDETKPAKAVSAVEETLIHDNAAEANAINAAALPQKTVVRVGLDRLDEMVKLMGEMVINRTVLEQRLKDIENQLSEMRLSTNRLRRIAGKLEVDYEANQLQNSDFGLRMFGKGNLEVTTVFSIQNPKSKIQNHEDKHGFDDLEFDRYTEFHELTRQLVETTTDTTSITGDLDELLSDFDGLLLRQRRLTDDLQEKMMRVRMVPLGTIVARLHRTVKVTAEAENKLVDLEIEGEDVEIDTQVLSALAEPLLHLLRNAVVHGIETPDARLIVAKPERGSIRLSAYHEGTHIVLSITDDGRGINPTKLREKAVRENFISAEEAAKMNDEQTLSLIFLPGFSTAKQLTESAGRGVGMDIVRESVLRQQGSISLKSKVGRGTTVLIRLPMSMAVTRSLIVRANGQRFALPLNIVQQLAQVAASDFDQLTQEKVLWVGSKFYAVHTLNQLLDLPVPAERDGEWIPVLLVQTGENTVALVLDEVVEAREIVIKPLNNSLLPLRGLLGAAILGDGSVVPILDLAALLARNAECGMQYEKSIVSHDISVMPQKETIPHSAFGSPHLKVMIVDDSPSVRRVMSNFVTKSGFTAIAAKDGLEAIEMLQQARELPDVVLSDVEMPRMDGYELLTTLKRHESFSHLPVVMITSRAGEKHRTRALELGASEYVTKPYQDSVLLEMIKRLANSVA